MADWHGSLLRLLLPFCRGTLHCQAGVRTAIFRLCPSILPGAIPMGMCAGPLSVSCQIRGFFTPNLFAWMPLIQLQTLYIYLSIAALVGLTGGLAISLVYSSLQHPLGLDVHQKPAGRTAKQYRKEKQKRKTGSSSPLSSPQSNLTSGYFSLSDGLRRPHKGKGLLTQTIMEEGDSDF